LIIKGYDNNRKQRREGKAEKKDPTEIGEK
jgi:hypothetical protein